MLLTRGLGDKNMPPLSGNTMQRPQGLPFQLSYQHSEVEASRELVLSGKCIVSTHQGWRPPECNLNFSRISPIGVL